MPEVNGVDNDMDELTASWTDDVTNNANATCVTLVQQGASAHNRRGNIIDLKSLRVTGELRCQIFQHTQAAVPPLIGGNVIRGAIARMLIIYDSRPGDVIPDLNEIIGADYDDGLTGVNVLSPLKMGEMGRFRILRDQKITMNPGAIQGVTDGTIVTLPVDVYVSLKGYQTTYKSNTNPASVADIATGAIYVYGRATENDGDTALYMWQQNARLRFCA